MYTAHATCNGRATWRMTAWRHLHNVRDEGLLTRPSPVKKLRKTFEVTEGTVVVPYYPVVNDMIKIKGDDGQVWKARVLSFNLTRLTFNAKFFIEDVTQIGRWVPERSPVQVIHFNSVLGISKGHWQVENSSWIDEED